MRVVRIGRAGLVAWACLTGVGGPRADPATPVPGRFEAALQRPLFSPTRRPPPPPLPMAAAPALAMPAAPPGLPQPPPDLALSGVILGVRGGGVALLRRPQDAAPARVALGGEIDGWKVAEIHPRAVVLRRDDRRVTVDLPVPAR